MTFLDTEREYEPPASPFYNGAPAGLAGEAPSPNRERIEALRKREDEALESAISSMNRGTEIAEQKSAALAPIRERMMEASRQPLPEAPQPQAPPAVPKKDRHEDENWLFAASLLGALGGGLSRRHVTNALGAFQGAMEGYAQGSRQKFDQDMKTWEAENKRIIEINKSAQAKYQEILSNRKLSQEQMSVELQMAAMPFDDQAMITAAKSKNSLVIAQLVDKHQRELEKFEKAGGSISSDKRAAHEREQMQLAQEEANSEKGMRLSEAIADLREPPRTATARNSYAGFYDRAIMDNARRISIEKHNREYNINDFFRGQTPARAERATTIARALQDPRKEQTALNQFERRLGDSVRSLNVAIDHLDVLHTLSKALETNQIEFANRIQGWIGQQAGVAAPRNFDAAKAIIAQEVVKAIVPGGGGVQERQEAAEHLARYMSPEQFEGTISTLQRLMAGQLMGLRTQYEAGTNRTDFDKRLADETKNVLDRIKREGIPDPRTEMRDLINKMGGNTSTAWGKFLMDALQTTNQGDRTFPSGATAPGARPPGARQFTQPIPPGVHNQGSLPLPEGWSVKEVPEK